MSQTSVIHDLGYRHWQGERQGRAQRVLYLLRHGWAACYGIGRGAKGKIVPWLLVGILLIPVIISAGAQLMIPIIEEPVFAPARVPYAFQMVFILFAATQAPVLFSADLRHRTIVHYLARPISRMDYVLARWGGLAAALFCLQAVAVVVLALGWWLDGGPVGPIGARVGIGLLGSLVVAGVIAALSGLLAALTSRKGVATAVIAGTLMVLSVAAAAVTNALQDSSASEDLAAWGPALNPFTLVERVVHEVTGAEQLAAAPDSATAAVMAGLLVLLCAALGAGLVQRYRKAG